MLLLLAAASLVPVPNGTIHGPARISPAAAGPAGIALSNGLVAVAFSGPVPILDMNSSSNPVVLTQTLRGLAEVNGSSEIVAYAYFEARGFRWNATSFASPSGTTAVFSAAVPVRSSTGEWDSGEGSGEGENTSFGTVNVSIAFTLNDSSGPAPRTLSYTLNVSSWPWQHPNDSLGLEVLTNASGTSGAWATSGPSELSMHASANNSTLATYAWGASAVAGYRDGMEAESSVDSYRNVSTSGLDSLLRLDFAMVQGGYESLEFDPWLSLPAAGLPSPIPAWVFTPSSVTVLGIGTGLTVALAMVVRRRRRPPGEDL